MWIIPNNHPLASHFATESVGSTMDLKKQSEILSSSLLWKSKQWPSRTWSLRLKQVGWLQRLSTRMLNPSQLTSFEIKLTGLLGDILVNRSPMPENAEALMIHDTFSRILSDQSSQCDLFAVSSKTSQDISLSDSPKFTEAYEKWVTLLRQEYSRRKKSVRHTREKGYSSSQSEKISSWPTATVMNPDISEDVFKAKAKRLKERNNGKNGTKRNGNGAGPSLAMMAKWKNPGALESEGCILKELTGDAKFKLRDQVNWLTPRANEPNEDQESYLARQKNSKHKKNQGKKRPGSLKMQVSWGTPTSRDYKDGSQESVKNVPVNGLLGRMVHTTDYCDGQQGQDSNNMNGNLHEQLSQTRPLDCSVATAKSILRAFSNGKLSKLPKMVLPHRLNPRWVAQLMGMTFEKTFFVHLETPFAHHRQNER